MPLTAGLGWAYAMLGLEMVEWLALIHIRFMDLPLGMVPEGSGFFELYFAVATFCLACQWAGTVLVWKRWYRTGGVLQILSSLLHVPKGEGLIGLVGGIKALRHAGAQGRDIQRPDCDFAATDGLTDFDMPEAVESVPREPGPAPRGESVTFVGGRLTDLP